TSRPAAARPTPTAATGTSFTDTAALPVCPSLVAIMVTTPAAAPVTSPVADTVATPQALDIQTTERPESTLPAASFSVALSCTDCPTRRPVAAGLTLTEATGATGTSFTVTAALPVCPSLVAVMVAAPVAAPVTSPLADTVATPQALDTHTTERPESTLPVASFSVAESLTDCPTRRLVAAGLT